MGYKFHITVIKLFVGTPKFRGIIVSDNFYFHPIDVGLTKNAKNEVINFCLAFYLL